MTEIGLKKIPNNMNRSDLDAFLEDNYYQLIKNINDKVHSIPKTKELISNITLFLYENINKIEPIPNNERLFKYFIACCLKASKWKNSDYNLFEAINKNQLNIDTTEFVYADQIIKDNTDYINLNIDIDSYPSDYTLDKEDLLVLMERGFDVDKFKRVVKFYDSLLLKEKIMFELIFVEELSSKKIHKLLNGKVRVGKTSVLNMINAFKDKVKRELNIKRRFKYDNID